jgi:Ca2+-transporting ATPase
MRLFVIVAASFSLQMVIHHQENLAALFGTRPISLGQCAAWIVLGAVPLTVLETRKILLRPRKAGAKPLAASAGR